LESFDGVNQMITISTLSTNLGSTNTRTPGNTCEGQFWQAGIGSPDHVGTMNQYLAIEREYHRTIVVGDIHGCFDEFQQLLEAIDFCAADLLIHVGDMIDRGPASWDVARFFRETPNAYSALGNHERRVAGSIRGTSQPAWSQLQTLSLVDETDWLDAADFFEGLPAVIETTDVIVTHARLDPARPLDDQDPYFTCAVGGPSVVIECDDNGIPHWFHETHYDKPICIGHIGYDRVKLVERRLYALDEGAAKGVKLTAVVLPEYRIVSIPAAQDYYSLARQTWARQDNCANKTINELRLQIALPRGEPATWPLKLVRTLLTLEKPVENPVLVEAIEKLKSTIEVLEFNERIKTVQRELADRFGPFPEPGPARGDYIRKLKAAFGKHGVVVAKLINNEIRTLADLGKTVKHRGSLQVVRHLLDSLIE